MYGGAVYPVLEPALSGDDMYPENVLIVLHFCFVNLKCYYKIEETRGCKTLHR